MDIKIKGCQKISGEITPSGSKNSAVHLIPASILIPGKVIFENIPNITDVVKLVEILKKLGSKVEWDKERKTLSLDNTKLSFEMLTNEDLGNMRGTSLLWGALLSRFGKVDCADFPGGCTLGIRPLEPIYKVFRDLGVSIKGNQKGIIMSAEKAGAGEVWLSEMSPTATTNLLMLSSTLKGKTKIVGAASEPQVQDVCNFLIKTGVKISGIGSSVLEIEGIDNFRPTKHELLSDHYEIATFLALAAITGGEIKIHNSIPEHFKMINYEFSKFNINIEYKGDTARIAPNQKIQITGKFEDKTQIVRPQPWPALPVDLLPIFVPLALAAPTGYMIYHNWMYESGLFWTSELTKLGAEIIMADPHRVLVFGGRKLKAATLEAPYIIRAVVALVMATLISEGESKILNADALYRGHPDFSGNLKRLGARIEEIS